MKVTIKNSLVLSLASWLNELNLIGRESRERTRFVNLLAVRYQETEKFRMEILNKYAQKDEEGKNKVSEDGKSILLEDSNAYVKEVTELMEDEYVIQLDSKVFNTLKHIVLDTTYTFGPKEGQEEQEIQAKVRQASEYALWCECFEGKK